MEVTDGFDESKIFAIGTFTEKKGDVFKRYSGPFNLDETKDYISIALEDIRSGRIPIDGPIKMSCFLIYPELPQFALPQPPRWFLPQPLTSQVDSISVKLINIMKIEEEIEEEIEEGEEGEEEIEERFIDFVQDEYNKFSHRDAKIGYLRELNKLTKKPTEAQAEETLRIFESADLLTLTDFIDYEHMLDVSTRTNEIVPYNFFYKTLLNNNIAVWTTVDLFFFIAKDMDDVREDMDDVREDHEFGTFLSTFRGTQTTSEPFKDVLTQINAYDASNRTIYAVFYRVYFLIKSLCFILHDKPVNAFARELYNVMYNRTVKIFYIGEPYNSLLDGLWAIYFAGFNLQDAEPMVTQTRCHRTLNELTNFFDTALYRDTGIVVPKTICLISIPYSVFREKEEKSQEEFAAIIQKNVFGLGDAVGNDKFITDYGLIPVYPNTCAKQDAAPTTYEEGTVKITETSIINDTAIDHEYTMDLPASLGSSRSQIQGIEPIRFGDVSIYCVQPGGTTHIRDVQPFVLYYAAEQCFTDDAKARLPAAKAAFVQVLTPHNLQGYINIMDDGVLKVLIAVSHGRISQNETIPLVQTIRGMTQSARGKKALRMTNKIFWLDKDSGFPLENEVRIIVAADAKEAGDQSKVKLIENVSKLADRKTMVATVDGFFSKSFIIGTVLFKGGNVEYYQKEGSDVLTEEQIMQIAQVIFKAKTLGYGEIWGRVHAFFNQLSQCIEPVILDTDNVLPFPEWLTYAAIYKASRTPDSLLIPEAEFNSFMTFDRNKHTGITDTQSFVRRILKLDVINNAYAIYEEHLNNPFSVKITNGAERTDLQIMIIDYLSLGYSIDSLIEQAPLFFLLDQIPKLRTPFRYRTIGSRDIQDGDLATITAIIKTKFLDKMQNYIDRYISGIRIDANAIFNFLITKDSDGNSVVDYTPISRIINATVADPQQPGEAKFEESDSQQEFSEGNAGFDIANAVEDGRYERELSQTEREIEREIHGGGGKKILKKQRKLIFHKNHNMEYNFTNYIKYLCEKKYISKRKTRKHHKKPHKKQSKSKTKSSKKSKSSKTRKQTKKRIS